MFAIFQRIIVKLLLSKRFEGFYYSSHQAVLIKMFSNYLNVNEMDPVLPGLLLEGSFLDYLLDAEIPLPAIQSTDIITLNQRIEQLSLDANTQALRLEIEKAKRQKLSTTVRRLKQDLLAPHPEIIKLRQDIDILRSEQNSNNYWLEAEIASNSVVTFCSLSRIHQILTIMSPLLMLPVNHSPDLNQLLRELACTLQQFCVEYTVSYI